MAPTMRSRRNAEVKVPAKTIGLAQAVSYALEHNSDLIAVHEQISAAGARGK